MLHFYAAKRLLTINHLSEGKMKTKIFFLVMSISLVLFTASLSAQVPQMISYQGKLTSAAGLLLDTTVAMTFSIYTSAVGDTPIWVEAHPSVQVEKGVFSVFLGSVISLPPAVFNDSVRYLGVAVGSDPEMSPRKRIASVAYAYKSLEADTADAVRGGAGAGDITAVMAGSGLSGGGTQGDVTLNVAELGIQGHHIADNTIDITKLSFTPLTS